MKALYSIAIHPSEDIIVSIKTMKEELAAKIGWFNSKNSIAHITINEFEANDAQITIIKKHLTELCDTLQPVEVRFNIYGSFPNNGAFFIAPEETSKTALKGIMKYLNDALRVAPKFKSNEPHISIARRLTPEKLAIAHAFFSPIDMHFLCDSVVIRKFNTIQQQFEVVDTIPFNSNTASLPAQGILF